METIRKDSARIKLVFSQTLKSQSVASVSMGSLAAYLRAREFRVDMCLLDENGLHNAEAILNNRAMHNIIIAKPNFKDFPRHRHRRGRRHRGLRR